MGVLPTADAGQSGARRPRLAIVGTGLIGASVGLAAKQAGVAQVAGFDPDSDALRVARERGAVDLAAATLAEAVSAADLVIVAAPVANLPALVLEVLQLVGEFCTVTDVGSTKSAVCAAADDDNRFIGGHPVCGSETSGPEYASAEIFEGATWFLTPQGGTDPDRYRVLHNFVASLGAHPVAIDAAAHDRLVALTSHLPHALSNLLVNQAGSTRVEGH
ncbi:MAG TPA: prephenate dehydrogenase/arogenate dehydrogenase family protein, partial [Candidatus Limnocylindrales bacterium]